MYLATMSFSVGRPVCVCVLSCHLIDNTIFFICDHTLRQKSPRTRRTFVPEEKKKIKQFWDLSTQPEMQTERDMWDCEPSTLFIAVTPRGDTWCGVLGRPLQPY